jgi:ribosomal protein L16 Arg81 hydroxylase
MRRTKQVAALLLMLTLVFMATGCPQEQKESFRKQAITQTDRLANSLKLATGITKELYKANKIDRETAQKWAAALSAANSKGKWLGDKIRTLDANSTSLPSDLTGALDEIESLLKSFGVSIQYAELARVIADAVATVNTLRGLIK